MLHIQTMRDNQIIDVGALILIIPTLHIFPSFGRRYHLPGRSERHLVGVAQITLEWRLK